MDSKDTKKASGEKEFSIQPVQDGIDPKTAPHKAHPGPVLTSSMPAQEGTKDDRQAKKAELNK
ncbi:hypothetical protein AAL_07172 [Moelleriella libera RCEF 2490]|uniref:Uncharacterized protein n=1 Tax=Moelleriella libera RCEF 2490 TaxID=1081109 RepID=A0A167XUK2_9HYPO|nr:hypothetical protein AAL_07172 [Moelleriella libera RCEF 2490]